MKRALEGQTKNIRTEERLFNFRPALFAALFLCLGILTGYFCVIDGGSAWWAVCIVPALSPSFFLLKNKKRVAIGVTTLCVAFAVGLGSFAVAMKNYRAIPAFDGIVTVTGQVYQTERDGYGLTVFLRDVSVNEQRTEGKLVAHLGGGFLPDLRLADVVILHGKVTTERDGIAHYGLAAAEIADGIKYTLTSVDGATVAGYEFDLGLWLRERMVHVLGEKMSPTSAALTLALLTGDTSRIGIGLLQNVRYGGIAHIFAVSGMHIGALYAFCRLLIDKTKLKKLLPPVRFLLVSGVLIFYGYVCGFSASVLRAVCLCLITYACSLLAITSDLLESLGLALFLVLCCSPTLLFEVGCLLSFSACFGIALLSRRIQCVLDGAGMRLKRIFVKEQPKNADWLPPNTKPPTFLEKCFSWFNGLLSVSLAAQIGTAPIQLYFFGYLSSVGILFNLFFVPLIGICFGWLIAFVAVACLFPAVAGGLLYAPSVLWEGLTLAFEVVDFSPFALTGVSVTFEVFLSYYWTVILLSDKINLKKWRWGYALKFFCLTVAMVLANYG